MSISLARTKHVYQRLNMSQVSKQKCLGTAEKRRVVLHNLVK